ARLPTFAFTTPIGRFGQATTLLRIAHVGMIGSGAILGLAVGSSRAGSSRTSTPTAVAVDGSAVVPSGCDGDERSLPAAIVGRRPRACAASAPDAGRDPSRTRHRRQGRWPR